MSAPRKKDVSDFQKITGLTEQIAKECFTAFGSTYAVALASFAQSYRDLPKSYFVNANAATENFKEINDELRAIYRRARALKAKSNQPDKEVWRRYEEEEEKERKEEAEKIEKETKKEAATPACNPFAAASAFAAPPPSLSSSTASPFAAAAGRSIFPAPTTAPATTSPIHFGFGFARSAPEAPGVVTSATITTTTAATAGNSGGKEVGSIPAAFAGFGKPANAAANKAVEKAATQKKAPEETPATHFTGPFFELPKFWEEEVLKRAPLFNCDKGFIEMNKHTLRPRMEKWLKRTSFYRKPIKYLKIDDVDEEVVRVIIKDADRTFFFPEHRTKLVAFLHAVSNEFKAYGQAMSYLSALCMLALSEEETASVIRFVSTEYIKGHWAAEAVGFATSAWVVEYFMQKKFPDVAKHLDSLNLWPDTYLQKILTGLCIHVLSFNELFDFLDAFMSGGLRYLIRFCLAIVEHFHEKILAIKSSVEANTLYEIMRLDRNVADRNDVRAILDRAPQIDLGEEEENIDLIRSQVYEKKVAPRLVRAPKTNTFEPCVLCEEGKPEWWSEDLGAVCSPCKEANPGNNFESF